MKIIIAMSGGVDSSVAAYLLKEQGHEVIGLSLELWDSRDLEPSAACCSVETVNLARTVAETLGIPHYSVDVRDAFYSYVIESFCESYLRGTTPNPCILCNRYIKFDYLLKKADELCADLVATGHYARIEKIPLTGIRRPTSGDWQPPEEIYLLKKGVDPKKDQSYVLYVMTQEHLSRTVFPLGGMTKKETRDIALKLNFITALRPESQEICFVGNDRYGGFIRRFAPGTVEPGPVRDTAGSVIGQHRGIAFYTIGQRKGLGIAVGRPLYVVGIDRESNTLIVGPQEDALIKSISVNELHWISGEPPDGPCRVSVKIRSTMNDVPAELIPNAGGTVRVEFDESQWAPAPGQSAVFYEGDLVRGGGIIV